MYFCIFIFKKITVSLKPFWKNVIVEEELDCFGIDNVGNVEDSPRFVFMDEECGIVNDGKELTRSINQKKNSDVLK